MIISVYFISPFFDRYRFHFSINYSREILTDNYLQGVYHQLVKKM